MQLYPTKSMAARFFPKFQDLYISCILAPRHIRIGIAHSPGVNPRDADTNGSDFARCGSQVAFSHLKMYWFKVSHMLASTATTVQCHWFSVIGVAFAPPMCTGLDYHVGCGTRGVLGGGRGGSVHSCACIRTFVQQGAHWEHICILCDNHHKASTQGNLAAEQISLVIDTNKLLDSFHAWLRLLFPVRQVSYFCILC